ncbi:MAG: fumarylacetoacetate hydrolase family protein, partial [Proteobacteria bacterium]|nr:fumarylacetoacetate hydrolase family protein [Pseudomonadota bacterium]
LAAVLTGHRAEVVRPAGITTLDYEPELAFVIHRRAHGIRASEAMDYVGAVMLFNDMTAREIQQREVKAGTRFWTAKNMPGFGPLGPVLVSLDEIGDPHDLTIVCRVNGAERLRFQPNEQIYRIPAVLEHFSRYVPFEPGDLMSLGAPAGTAIGQDDPTKFFLVPGDIVEIHCDQIGTLATRIIEPA